MRIDKYESFGVNLSNVRNSCEVEVIKHMNQLLPDFPEFDYCTICIQDVYALSMNQLTPKYMQEGTVLLKKEHTSDDFKNAVQMAVQRVIKNPNHP